MKKNLISILILALLIVNIILTAIMMISVTGAAKKTSDLVGNISSILNLELTSAVGGEEEAAVAVALKDTEVYKIEDQMTIPFKLGEDGKSHFCLVSVSLSQNIKDKDYKEYGGANIGSKEDLIKAKIVEVIGNYTVEEAQGSTVNLQDEILKAVQTMFDSKFIYEVVFRDVVFQ